MHLPMKQESIRAMHSIRARKASAADMEAVLALYRELRPDDPAIDAEALPSLWRDVAEGEWSSVLVAEIEGEIAATCMLATLANLASGGRRIGVIEHVITANRFRRRGAGRMVLELALSQAWDAGCCKVMLLSGAQRAEARRVYEAIGFRGDVERGYVIKRPTAA